MKAKPSATLKRLRKRVNPTPKKLVGCQYLHVPKTPLHLKKHGSDNPSS